MSEEKKVKRVPVDFDYSALNWDFIKLMAQIPPYAAEKYGSWEQYKEARLEGEKSCENHIIEHLRQFMLGEPYDKFEGDVGRHLAAIAYNAMMSWYYLKKFGHKPHPLLLEKRKSGQTVVEWQAVVECNECGGMLIHQIGCSKGGPPRTEP